MQHHGVQWSVCHGEGLDGQIGTNIRAPGGMDQDEGRLEIKVGLLSPPNSESEMPALLRAEGKVGSRVKGRRLESSGPPPGGGRLNRVALGWLRRKSAGILEASNQKITSWREGLRVLATPTPILHHLRLQPSQLARSHALEDPSLQSLDLEAPGPVIHQIQNSVSHSCPGGLAKKVMILDVNVFFSHYR